MSDVQPKQAFTYRDEDMQYVYKVIVDHVPFIHAEKAVQILRGPIQIGNIQENPQGGTQDNAQQTSQPGISSQAASGGDSTPAPAASTSDSSQPAAPDAGTTPA